MAKVNTPPAVLKTHEGGRAQHINAEQQLRRSLMACMLWENSFYENGVDISQRIADLVPQVDPAKVAAMAVEARGEMKLRHAPLWIVRQMAKHPKHKAFVSDTLYNVIQRADELAEFVALYWLDGKQPLSKQVKLGLAQAFTKFDAYQLAKYDRGGQVKLRDVLFLCHAKPKDEEQGNIWKQLIDGALPAPDTWEVELSQGKGEDQKGSWERLLQEKKLGGLALIRNLRNMYEAGVDQKLVFNALKELKTGRILPFRFITAANAVPQWESHLETAMLRTLEGSKQFEGRTVLLIDVSSSMDSLISDKSKLMRMDAACGLAILARELCPDISVWTFSNDLKRVPDRHGFALRDAIVNSQDHRGTYIGQAVQALQAQEKYDRLIIMTDEQSHDAVPAPLEKGYMINVAAYRNGVGYGAWTHVDGWSEKVLDYIQEIEI